MGKYNVLFVFLLFAICLPKPSSGQFLDFKQFEPYTFRSIGPAGMSGRVTCIDVDLSHDQRIFAGSASGGLWLSENGGTSWQPAFDSVSTLAIGAVKINQKNPAEIWVGTGEGNPRNSLNTGNGIYKSIDGGRTWKHMGLANTKTIHRIIIDENNPNTVFVAAPGSPWGKSEDRGVFKTTDGGKTWNKILYVNDETGAADMIVDPNNPNKLLVSMWQHQRKPWTFNSGGKGSGLYLSYDGGATWKKLDHKAGLPEGDLGRIGLAAAPQKPNIVYALVEAKENGLYKSDDGGLTWSLVSSKNIGDRPFYYAELYVDPQNENRIYNIYTYVSRSEDGGKTFKNIANYGNRVHPDHHAFWLHPTKAGYLIDGNDGGLNISRDGGDTWHFATNLPIGQFYHINVDNDFPYNVYGGLQDNGSWVGPSSVLKQGGITNADFQELYFGDGFDVVPLPSDSRYGYAMSQGGNVGFYDRKTGFTQPIKPVHPDPKMTLRFNWNAAIAQSPFENCGVYFGSQFLHYSQDCGQSWTIISPDLTTNDTTKMDQKNSGGLTPDATGAENYCTIISISPDTKDQQNLWVGTDDGQVQLTRDGGKTWKNVAKNMSNLPKNAWIAQIEVSKIHAGEAFVVVNNYRQNDYTPYLYHTKDYGQSWENLANKKTMPSFLLSLKQDVEQPNLLFLGADNGLYFSFDYGKSWQHWDDRLPHVQITDIKLQEREADLVLGTFGRAIYVLDDITPLRVLSKDYKDTSKVVRLFEPQEAYHVSYQSYFGVRFAAQGDFVGTNDRIGQAMIHLWRKPSPADDKKKKEQKVEIAIIHPMSGDTLRKFQSDIKDGLNRVYWGLEVDGVKFPGKDLEPSKYKPGGYEIMPGKYKLVATLDKHKDSTNIEVKFDPRTSHSVEKWQQKQDRYKKFYANVNACKKAYDVLVDAQMASELVDKLLVNQPDTIKKQFTEKGKKLRKEIDSLMYVYHNPPDLKGLNHVVSRLNSKLYSADDYLANSIGAPSANTVLKLEQVEQECNNAATAVDKFVHQSYLPYQEEVKKLKLILFKPTE